MRSSVNGHEVVVRLLIEHNADSNAVNHVGDDMCIRRGILMSGYR